MSCPQKHEKWDRGGNGCLNSRAQLKNPSSIAKEKRIKLNEENLGVFYPNFTASLNATASQEKHKESAKQKCNVNSREYICESFEILLTME